MSSQLFYCILILSLLLGCSPVPHVCFSDQCFTVDIASTPAARTQGLMYRESLDVNSGLLLIFDESSPPRIWMKDMSFPLDVVWMNYDGVVVSVARNIQPCKTASCPMVQPQRDALYALEIRAHAAALIQAGDVARLPAHQKP